MSWDGCLTCELKCALGRQAESGCAGDELECMTGCVADDLVVLGCVGDVWGSGDGWAYRAGSCGDWVSWCG